VGETEVEWFLHVGDLFWYPCSDEALEARLAEMRSVPHPVVYTPGDNEWTDCHDARTGSYDPLDRLAAIRRLFFVEPRRSLGAASMTLVSQVDDSLYAEFPENVRWTRGGFVFATIHLVGSSNGLEAFPARTDAHDSEVERRSAAAIDWLDETFAAAEAAAAKGVVLAMHANIGLDPLVEPRVGYEPFVARLAENVESFSGVVLLIHGDSHEQRIDQPLKDAEGRIYASFTRLETFGSPDIGWMRVVVDTVAGRFIQYEPRRMRGWW
jgi:hypothetical protein